MKGYKVNVHGTKSQLNQESIQGKIQLSNGTTLLLLFFISILTCINKPYYKVIDIH